MRSSLLPISTGRCTIDVKRKGFVRRDADQRHPNGTRNGQAYLGQDGGGFLLDVPVNAGTNNIGIGHRHALGIVELQCGSIELASHLLFVTEGMAS